MRKINYKIFSEKIIDVVSSVEILSFNKTVMGKLSGLWTNILVALQGIFNGYFNCEEKKNRF